MEIKASENGILESKKGLKVFKLKILNIDETKKVSTIYVYLAINKKFEKSLKVNKITN